MDTLSNEQMSKLPKWAQGHINKVERERDMAIRTLNEFRDESTPSPFSYEKNPCTGERSGPVHRQVFIQTHSIEVNHRGIFLRVCAVDDRFELSWCGGDRHSLNEVAMIPESYQRVRLVAKENMRH